MIELILGAAASTLPTVALGAGPLGLVTAFFARSGGIPAVTSFWLKVAAATLLAIAVAGATVHYMKLRADSAALHELQPRIAGLEASLGCPDRPAAAERDLFACIPARDRDAEHARAEAIRQNEGKAAIARAALERTNKALKAELDARDELIEDASAADDGPLPKVLLDAWRRERVKRGVK
jgi:hypothetical protein